MINSEENVQRLIEVAVREVTDRINALSRQSDTDITPDAVIRRLDGIGRALSAEVQFIAGCER